MLAGFDQSTSVSFPYLDRGRDRMRNRLPKRDRLEPLLNALISECYSNHL